MAYNVPGVDDVGRRPMCWARPFMAKPREAESRTQRLHHVMCCFLVFNWIRSIYKI